MPDSPPVLVYDSQSEHYRMAFKTFLRNTDQKKKACEWLDRFLAGLPQKEVFIDAGAGTGELCVVSFVNFPFSVYAIQKTESVAYPDSFRSIFLSMLDIPLFC